MGTLPTLCREGLLGKQEGPTAGSLNKAPGAVVRSRQPGDRNVRFHAAGAPKN